MPLKQIKIMYVKIILFPMLCIYVVIHQILAHPLNLIRLAACEKTHTQCNNKQGIKKRIYFP